MSSLPGSRPFRQDLRETCEPTPRTRTSRIRIWTQPQMPVARSRQSDRTDPTASPRRPAVGVSLPLACAPRKADRGFSRRDQHDHLRRHQRQLRAQLRRVGVQPWPALAWLHHLTGYARTAANHPGALHHVSMLTWTSGLADPGDLAASSTQPDPGRGPGRGRLLRADGLTGVRSAHTPACGRARRWRHLVHSRPGRAHRLRAPSTGRRRLSTAIAPARWMLTAPGRRDVVPHPYRPGAVRSPGRSPARSVGRQIGGSPDPRRGRGAR